MHNAKGLLVIAFVLFALGSLGLAQSLFGASRDTYGYQSGPWITENVEPYSSTIIDFTFQDGVHIQCPMMLTRDAIIPAGACKQVFP